MPTMNVDVMLTVLNDYRRKRGIDLITLRAAEAGDIAGSVSQIGPESRQQIVARLRGNIETWDRAVAIMEAALSPEIKPD